jgi:hypothetical protein
MISAERWSKMTSEERSLALREEIKTVEGNTRSLKKMLLSLAGRVDEIRRHFGMKKTT